MDMHIPDWILSHRPSLSHELGRVVRVERGSVLIKPTHRMDGDSDRVARGQFSSHVVTGDYVWSVGREQIVVPRLNSLERAATSVEGSHILAANLDEVWLVLDSHEATRAAWVERMATVGWASGIGCLMVVTKWDVASERDRGTAIDVLTSSAPGMSWLAVSSSTGEGIGDTKAKLEGGRTVGLVGHSGVGKSSLINAMANQARVQVGDLRPSDGKGRHTTTWRELVSLPGGGHVIDTPGVRELGVLSPTSLDEVYEDVQNFAQGCWFSDCTHNHEPRCEVSAAVSRGDLDQGRLDRMEELRREAAFVRRKNQPEKRDKSREWTRMAREYKQIRGH